MTKLISLAVLGCCGLLTCTDQAQACNGGCCAAPVAGSPVQAMPNMKMPAAPTAAAPQGYRTYSYQPGNYAPRSMSRGYRPYSGFHDAGWKAGVGR